MPRGDRKSVVEGKRVDLGGRRIIKKKKKKKRARNNVIEDTLTCEPYSSSACRASSRYLTGVRARVLSVRVRLYVFFFFFKQKTAYEIRPRDWSFRRVLFR